MEVNAYIVRWRYLKSTRITFEALVVMILLWFVGERFLPSLLLSLTGKLELMDVFLFATAGIAPLGASVYILLRSRKFTLNFFKKEIVQFASAGIIAVFLITRLEFALQSRSGEIYGYFSESHNYLIWNFIMVVLWIPLCEEIFYRGFIFERLKDDWNLTVSVVFSSLLFTSIHILFWLIGIFIYESTIPSSSQYYIYNLVGYVGLFAKSCIFAVMYEKGGLMASSLGHVFLNSYLFWQ